MELFSLFGKIGIKNQDANKAIDDTTGKAQGAESKIGKAFSSIGNVAVKAGKAIATGLAVGAVALGTLTATATKHYADYEQLVGGVETLFGAGGQSLEKYAQSVGKSVDEASEKYNQLMSAQNEVINNSKNAFKTAGLSANEYMETVTGFSASLIQSLGGDTEKAAKLGHQAVVDMSDNANKMGTDMEAIQNAYAGFSKQNYTMLDNLKLGFGGTKEEMQRLLDEAEKISGIKYNIDSFADVTEAIHVMQESMGIAGTTMKEAEATISGSIGMLKSAWTNFLTGMADPDQNMEELVNNVTYSFQKVVENVVPRLLTALPRIVSGLSQIFQTIAGYLPEILQVLLPALISGATELLGSLFANIPVLFSTFFNSILPQVSDAFISFLDSVFSKLPPEFSGLKTAYENIKQIILDVITLVSDFFSGFVGADDSTSKMDNLKNAIKAVFDFLGDATGALKDFLEWITSGKPEADAFQATLVAIGTAFGAWKISSWLSALGGLPGIFATAGGAVTGFAGTVTAAISSIPIIGWIAAVVAALAWFFTQTETGKEIWKKFTSFLGESIEAAKQIVSDVTSKIVSSVTEKFESMKAKAVEIWDGLKNSIKEKMDSAKDLVKTAIDKIKGFFNFEWSLPRPKIPSFRVSGGKAPWGFMGKGSLPSVGIEWYKNGGIMTSPTLFGMNGNRAMVGGEAGPEAVLPLNTKTLSGIGKGIVDATESDTESLEILYQILAILQELLDKDPNIVLDDGTLVSKTWKKYKDKIDAANARKLRLQGDAK